MNPDEMTSIELGKEYWLDRFDIRIRDWRDDNGNTVKQSFVVELRKDDEVGRF